jgi:hypothetical protein
MYVHYRFNTVMPLCMPYMCCNVKSEPTFGILKKKKSFVRSTCWLYTYVCPNPCPACIILTLWFSILLRVYYKSSLTSTVRNFSLFYLFIYFIFNPNHTICFGPSSGHPQVRFLQAQYIEKITDINGSVDILYNVNCFLAH